MTTKPTRVPRFMSIDEVAETLKICTRTVRRWIKNGDLHVHRFGRRLRINEEDLVIFLNRDRT